MPYLSPCVERIQQSTLLLFLPAPARQLLRGRSRSSSCLCPSDQSAFLPCAVHLLADLSLSFFLSLSLSFSLSFSLFLPLSLFTGRVCVTLYEKRVLSPVQLEQELKSTSSRGETMNGVVAALPAEGDIERLRNYNWQDVQDLQEVQQCALNCLLLTGCRTLRQRIFWRMEVEQCVRFRLRCWHGGGCRLAHLLDSAREECIAVRVSGAS